MNRPRLAYLYSRFPHFSQTFCDTEMLGLEQRGWELVAASCYAPDSTFRHERLDRLNATLLYPPPSSVLRVNADRAQRQGTWPKHLVKQHDLAYGKSFSNETRARNALWLSKRLVEEGVEHIHIHFANRATHTALYILEMTQIPFSFTAHAQDFIVDLGSRELLKEMVSKARFVVAVSDYTTRMLQQWFPEYANKIHRIYNGLDTSEFVPPTNRTTSWPLPMFSVGRLIEFKGFHHLINALHQANTEDNASISLRIAGDGPWEERLRKQIEDLNMQNQVFLLGRLTQDQIRQEMRDAHAFVLASTKDPQGASDILPTVITEAMLSGLPVISTRLAGIPEMVMDGQTGILVDPGDEGALASALTRMANNPSRLKQNGIAGRERALQLFDRNQTISQLEQLFLSSRQSQDKVPTPREPGLIVLQETLGLENSRLAAEQEALADQLPQAKLLCAKLMPQHTLSTLDQKGSLLQRIDWMPDGVILEMHWLRAGIARQEVESLRSKLGSKVDGESFFLAARRAYWTASQIVRRFPESHVRARVHLHAQRSDTLLWAWLSSLLAGVPFTASIEHSPQISYAAIEEIAQDALSLWLERPEKCRDGLIGRAAWPLHAPQTQHKRLGNLRWQERTEPILAEQSQNLIDALRSVPKQLPTFTRRKHPIVSIIQPYQAQG